MSFLSKSPNVVETGHTLRSRYGAVADQNEDRVLAKLPKHCHSLQPYEVAVGQGFPSWHQRVRAPDG
jgi:hypothetical protein